MRGRLDSTKHVSRSRLVVRPPWLIGVGLVLLGLAWSFSSQAFQVPDEAAHYLRATEIADGGLLGPRAYYSTPGATAAELAFARHDARAVYVPGGMSPGNELCVDGRPDVNGCTEVTPTGDYYPVAYLLPAIGLKLAGNANEGLWFARILSLLPCLALIIAGLLALWESSGWSILGPLAALTPMVLFVCSILNPSGLEIASNFAFVAAALRIARAGPRAPRPVWILLAVSGVLTIDSFQSGPISALAAVAISSGLLGSVGLRELVAARRATVLRLGWLLLAAFGLWAVYSKISGVAHSNFDINPFWMSLGQGFTALRYALQDAVGTFGSLTVQLPMTVRWLWWLGVVALVLGALVLGGRRERIVVATTVVLVTLYPVLFFAWVYRLSGFGLQGRQILPMLMLIPLVSGEVIHRRMQSTVAAPRAAGASPARALPARPVARMVMPAALGAIAFLQGYAWFYNARASAGATAYDRFWAYANWSPPMGWYVWLVAAGLGVVALLVAAAGAYRVPGARTPMRPTEALA